MYRLALRETAARSKVGIITSNILISSQPLIERTFLRGAFLGLILAYLFEIRSIRDNFRGNSYERHRKVLLFELETLPLS